jgi:hypothetical protein
MRGSLFALFRGADGRSLVRALVALVLANAIVAGIHLAPASADQPTICSIAASSGAGGTNPSSDPTADHPCCQAGFMPVAMAAPSAPDLPLPAPGFVTTAATPADTIPVRLVRTTPLARGPPTFA